MRSGTPARWAAVRVHKAQKWPKHRDPNRPLDGEDVERFRFLVGTGASLKDVARKLNRTYEYCSASSTRTRSWCCGPAAEPALNRASSAWPR